MASLGLVSPGTANWWRHPRFFPEIKLATFFAHNSLHLRCHAYFSLQKLIFFSHRSLLPAVSHPPTSSILYKFCHNLFSFGFHPLDGVTRSCLPPLVTPLCWYTLSHSLGPIGLKGLKVGAVLSDVKFNTHWSTDTTRRVQTSVSYVDTGS